MAFLGEINHGVGATLNGSMPAGLLAMIGEDAKRYVIANPSGEAPIQVDCIETLTTVFTKTEAQWRTDLAGLSLGFTGTAFLGTEWGVPGTKYFFAVGYVEKVGYDEIVGVRYKIVDTSTLTVDGGFRYSARGYIGTFRLSPGCNGAAHIDSKCYAVCNTGGNLFDYANTFKAHLIELELTGTQINAASESWDGQITELPWEWGFLRANNERSYWDRACLIEVDAGIRIDCYIGKTEVDGNGGGLSPTIAALSAPAMLSTVVNPATHTHTGSNNVSASYGIPFSDTGLTYAGGAGTGRDDYTSPFQCSDGKIRMARGFSDLRNGRVREFSINATTGAITVGAVTDWELRNSAIALDQAREFIQVFKDGSDILWMLQADEYYAFGTVTGGSTPEEEDDEDVGDFEALCVVDWDPCILTPEDITVAIVAPTVSPGRSLSGREQVVQPDAGFFTVTLHRVKVWSETELQTWREYELKLDGRNNSACVPLYEAKLSDTPIVAVAGATAAVGAVRVTITQSAGASVRAGMHFEVGERAYRLMSNSGTSWRVWPPLRKAIANGAALNFNDPKLRCRMVRDDGMALTLEHLQFGKRDVVFVEDV